MSANAQIGAAGLVRLGLADLGIVRTGRHGLVCSSQEVRDQAGLAELCAAFQCVAHKCSAVTDGPLDSSGGPFQFPATGRRVLNGQKQGTKK